MNIVNIPTNGIFRLQVYLDRQQMAINLPVYAIDFKHEIQVEDEFITMRFHVLRELDKQKQEAGKDGTDMLQKPGPLV